MNWQDLQLETERLILRPPRIEDFDAYAANMADAESARFIGGQQTRAVAWRGMLQLAGAWHVQGFSMFSVIEKESGQWVGRLGPWYPDGWPGTEVGWGLARKFWGRGYALEACTAAMDWTFETLGWTEIVHCIHPDNAPSRALASRLGSSLRGPCRMPPPYDAEPCELWGQSRRVNVSFRAPGAWQLAPQNPVFKGAAAQIPQLRVQAAFAQDDSGMGGERPSRVAKRAQAQRGYSGARQ